MLGSVLCVLESRDGALRKVSHEVVAAGRRIAAKVDAIVQTLIANGPAAVKASKKLVQDLAGQPLTAALRADTARRIADIRASDEGREGVQSFLNKRTPRWQASE